MNHGKTEETRFNKGIKDLAKKLEEERNELLQALKTREKNISEKEDEWEKILREKNEELDALKEKIAKGKKLYDETILSIQDDRDTLSHQLNAQHVVHKSEIKEKTGVNVKLEKGLRELAKRVEQEKIGWEGELGGLNERVKIIRKELEEKEYQLKFMDEHYKIKRETDLSLTRLEERFREARIKSKVRKKFEEEITALINNIKGERAALQETFKKLQDENRHLREEISGIELSARRIKAEAGAVGGSSFTAVRPHETIAERDDIKKKLADGVKEIVRKLEAERLDLGETIKKAYKEEIPEAREKITKKEEEIQKLREKLRENEGKKEGLEKKVQSLNENINEKNNEIDTLVDKLGKKEKIIKEKKISGASSIDSEIKSIESIFERERQAWREKLRKRK